MMSSFRRFASSPFGVAVFAIIIIAFIVTLYEGKSGLNGISSGGSIANVGSVSITDTEATRRVQNQMETARQQDPTVDLPGFVRAGGVERTVEQLINGLMLEQFARSQGLFASKRLVDGMIASIAAFNGPDGKFDRNTYLTLLQQRKIPEAQLRADFAREAVTKALLIPVSGGARMPLGIAQTYATLLLEQREGQVGFVPTQAFVSATPLSDADIAAFYKTNIAAYTVPERRIIKYATFDRSRFDGKIVPTDAEVAAAYSADAAKYAARENRGFTQLIVLDKSDADRLYDRVKGGLPIADAAKSLGLEALSVAPTDKAAFAKQTSGPVADAAFAAPRGTIAALAQSGLGYHIVRVDTVQAIAARSVAEARPEIVAALTKTKTDAAITDLLGKIDDDIGGGSTFDEVAKTYALTATETPPITSTGTAPETATYALPDAVKPLLRDAFQAESGDDAQVGSLPNGTGYVLYHMDRVIPAAPKPLATVKQQVAADATTARAYAAARKIADGIVGKVKGGTTFAQALSGAGVALPAPKPAGGQRLAIAQGGDKVPAPVKALFALAPNRATILPAPGRGGWYIVYLARIIPGDPKAAAAYIPGTQQQLSQLQGEEYAAQFANALRPLVGVSRNDAAVAALKRSLSGAQ